MSDYRTHDFINTMPNVVCGQVLMDRQRHIAIVAKKGRTSFHLICVSSGMLRAEKCTPQQITAEWMDAEYPYEKALAHLLDMGRKHGVTDAAKVLLDGLAKHGKEPMQGRLFS
ncbi:MAG TPA: hypothetical protein VMW07_00260 [Gallionella sp.]|nr:hypothetical protein [Gallionella sp.]